MPIMSASMIAPCLPQIALDMHISTPTLSSYFLGMAFVPHVIASRSRIQSRKPV
jgi:hypothetical protein